MLVSQTNGALDNIGLFTNSIRGGVCRDKASALTGILKHYGLDAKDMVYWFKLKNGKIEGHEISVVRIKGIGFVGLDPTNYNNPVPIEIPEEYRHLFPISPDLNKMAPMNVVSEPIAPEHLEER